MCGPSTADIIIQNGGIDGRFGPNTTKAVKIFQGGCGLSQDGSVGPNTWAAIANSMAGEGAYFQRYSQNVIYLVNTVDNTANLYYCNENGAKDGWLHTVTFN